MFEGNVVDIKIKWDEEARVWFCECDEIGLALESGSYDALIERIKMAIPEMIELNNVDKNTMFFIDTEKRPVAYA